jgi:Transposase and inactivated derivatives
MRSRAVAAVEGGQPIGQVAEAYQVNRTTLFRWAKRFATNGARGLERRLGSGRPRLLAAFDMEALNDIVLEPASNFGFETDLWTVGRLQQVIREQYGSTVSRDTVWRRLREAGFTYQKPERRYFEVNEEARQEWMQTEAPQIRAAVREFRAILYFQDESNVSLTAFLGKTWAFRGQTPQVSVTGQRGGATAMSALSGQGRLVFQLFTKRITSEEVMQFLGQMLKHHPSRHLVVVMDQAPPHTSRKTRDYIAGQRRLHVHYLPKYSPDWNPDEKVWNHLKHHELKGHQAKTKEELQSLTQTKLETMSRNPSLLKGLFFRCCVADFFG